jgi:hypothetical protein
MLYAAAGPDVAFVVGGPKMEIVSWKWYSSNGKI